ncbi:unnamed protein product [Caenorhabditis auriculariae]|uniref:Thioredoxin-like fold domain-containing protein n=1 Tax=Caenorhabditis auriculariae TaxID=2777116 RepID=A0A8S1GZG2_9PELO|nr:unnamed protein product [Caenorhabditis auriculariae]
MIYFCYRMATFDQLYERCFKNVSLVKISNANAKEKSDESVFVTLDHVFTLSKYVVFLLTSSSRSSEISSKIEHLVNLKNEKDDKIQNSPTRLRRLFSLKKKSKKEEKLSCVSVVVIDAEGHDSDDISKIARPGWYVYVPQSSSVTSRLLRTLGFEFSPSVVVIECVSREVTSREGRRLLNEDEHGKSFPWWPPSSSSLLEGTLVSKGGVQKDFKDVRESVRGYFFGAFWCPPARQWVKQLIPVYEKLRSKGISLEIVFCSSDRTVDGFNQFLDQMPWPAFSYDPAKTSSMTRLFNVNGIPALILADDKGNVINRHGKSALLSDVDGNHCPWGPQEIYELTEHTMCRLREEPSLILFTEGSPEDIQFSLSILRTVSKDLKREREQMQTLLRSEQAKKREDLENAENANDLKKSSSCSSVDSESSPASIPDSLQVFYTGEDPICDHVLEKVLGLAEAELPLICIVDGVIGELSVCEDPDVSETVVRAFVEKFKQGKLSWQPLSQGKKTSYRTVAGIPCEILQQAAIVTSPSQQSIPSKSQ